MKELTTEQLKRRLESGEPVAVVDIREALEFAEWHIAGSRNVPSYDALRLDDPTPLLSQRDQLPRDRAIVTVCRRGLISRKAAAALEALGYDAASLIGGIRGWSLAWSEARIPLDSAPDAAFIQVRRNGKGCLSYLLGSNNEAAVVDPSVDAQVYLDLAARENLRITHVIETHVHADHLSRARELADESGASLMLPANERVTFDYLAVRDGDEIELGQLRLRAIDTPGHTGESMCYLINDDALLTGDTLFVDSVGRPDLERGDAGAADGAWTLYRSIHEKLLPLPDSLRIFPAHTGGEIGFDGRAITATLGELRGRLDLLRAPGEEFVRTIVAGLGPKPPGYDQVIAVNEGRRDLGDADPLDFEAGPNRCAATRG